MAKRALRKKEDIEAVPLDQSVELDLSPDDPLVVVTDDTKDDKKPPKKNGADAAPVVQNEEPDEEKATLRKQLEDLRAAESATRAEYERQVQEANRRAQELEQQNSQHQNQQLEAEYDSVLNAIAAAESEANAAAQAYDAAYNAGDGKSMAEAQRKISRAEARLERLEDGKAAIEYRREVAKAEPARKPTAQAADPLEAHIAQLPDLAKNWIRSHREYMENQDKNTDLQMAHLKAVKAKITPYTQSYIEFVEEELGLRQKKVTTEEDLGDDPPEPTRRVSVSAPVSREVVSPSTGRATSQKVTLTAEEREIARLSMPNTDPGEAERIYAQKKLELQRLKAQGHYQER